MIRTWVAGKAAAITLAPVNHVNPSYVSATTAGPQMPLTLNRNGGALYPHAHTSPRHVAPTTHGPVVHATSNDKTVPMIAIHNPQVPAIRPDGIGRSGWLMASTCRSNQSLTAWLVPHPSGPVNSTPAIRNGQRCAIGTPEETTPHMKAHIGGNQVTGLSNSSTSRGFGSGVDLAEAPE